MSEDKVVKIRKQMRDLFINLKYRNSNILDDYDYATATPSGQTSTSSARQMDVVAFTQSLPSLQTAALGVRITPEFSMQDAIESRALGAPHLIVIDPNTDQVTRWEPFALAEPAPITELPLAQLSHLFDDNEARWSSDAIEYAKLFGAKTSDPQLSFIDVGLWTATETQLRDSLTLNLERILKQCKDDYITRYNPEKFEAEAEEIHRLLFRLLTAKYLIDRKKGADFLDAPAERVVEWVEKRFYQKGSHGVVFSEEPLRSNVWKALKEGINLTNLSPGILAYLYENLLVSPELRRKYSIHATPPAVTEYLIRQLPLKEIGRDNLRIFEPFCGHAPFLTASMGRMRELETDEMTEEERHEYFKSRLVGMETSPFSRELAVNSLILADDAAGDNWQIVAGDVFNSPEFTEKLEWANVVLCNPPFKPFSAEEKQQLPKDVARSKEGEILRRVLERKPAALGFVLPRSVLDRTDFRSLRRQIADSYNNVHVTVFPDDVFAHADQETALLIAYQGDNKEPKYESAFVSKDDYPLFLQTGKVTWTDSHSAPDPADREFPLWQTPLQPIWNYLDTRRKFGEIAEIHKGTEYKMGRIDTCVSAEEREGFVEGIWEVRNFLEPFTLRDSQYLSLNKEEMRDNAYLLPWGKPKILVNNIRSSRRYWRMEGVVDELGLMAGRNYHGIWATGNAPLELIAALINSPMGNAFLFDKSSGRDNYHKWIKQIPVPHFTSEQTELIVYLVQSYATKRQEWIAEPRLAPDWEPMCRDLLYQIDAAVIEAYELPADLETLLLSQFTETRRGGLPFKFPGYGEEYTNAQERNRRELAFRRTLKRYHTLVDKTFIEGLTPQETKEKEGLRLQIGEYNAPIYKAMFDGVNAPTGMGDPGK